MFRKIVNTLRTDSMLTGVVLGIALPLVAFGLLVGLNALLEVLSGKDEVIKMATIALVSIFANLFTLRHYLVKLKQDRTGRGIMLVTFVLAIAYFALYLD